MHFIVPLFISSVVVLGLVNAYALFLHRDNEGYSFLQGSLIVAAVNPEDIYVGRLAVYMWVRTLPKIFMVAKEQIQGIHPPFFSHDFLWVEYIENQGLT